MLFPFATSSFGATSSAATSSNKSFFIDLFHLPPWRAHSILLWVCNSLYILLVDWQGVTSSWTICSSTMNTMSSVISSSRGFLYVRIVFILTAGMLRASLFKLSKHIQITALVGVGAFGKVFMGNLLSLISLQAFLVRHKSEVSACYIRHGKGAPVID